MQAQKAEVGARGVDSLSFSQGGSATQSAALKVSGIDFVVGYLGIVTPAILAAILASGLAFMPVTLAAKYDGPAAVAACRALGLPKGTTIWLDLEGHAAWASSPDQLAAKINVWADAITAAGYEAGLYIGSPQPFTSGQLFALKVTRYWRAPASVRDHSGALAEPRRGWCMMQLWPSKMWRSSGVFVDVDFIQQDFFGSVPTWVTS